MRDDSQEPRSPTSLGAGLVFGAALRNVGVGMVLGAGIGAVIGRLTRSSDRN